MVPLCEDAAAFSRRFGCDIYTVFNMTEVSTPILSGKNPSPLGTCGTPRPGVEVRIVDENDCEVAPGTVGELIVRTDAPWTMNHGYFRNPEATARAWRNGWFHTGDAFRADADGHYFFVDRIKDAIRRRGENISSFEVETEVCAHPAVKEAAAVAVPSEHAEDEVLVAVSLVEGASLDPAELIRFLLPRMAHFMVPRYVRVVPELPKTPTQKVQKHLVRSEGVTADTWDRVAAGIEVKRERIGTTVKA
jgi:crotonobetaine/carnitine-CoA ligase